MPETNPTVTVFEGLAPPNEGSEKSKMVFETADARVAASAENLGHGPGELPNPEAPDFFAGNQTGKANGSNRREPRAVDFEVVSGN
jgi:hypothetical protein